VYRDLPSYRRVLEIGGSLLPLRPPPSGTRSVRRELNVLLGERATDFWASIALVGANRDSRWA
jgi:hypothetical protein